MWEMSLVRTVFIERLSWQVKLKRKDSRCPSRGAWRSGLHVWLVM